MRVTANVVRSALTKLGASTINELAEHTDLHFNTIRNNLRDMELLKEVERLPGHPARYQLAPLETLEDDLKNEALIKKYLEAIEENGPEFVFKLGKVLTENGVADTLFRIKHLEYAVERYANKKEFTL